MLRKFLLNVQLLIRSWFIKISNKINIPIFKIIEILAILSLGIIGLVNKDILFISILTLLLLQHLSSFLLYIKYDTKETAAIRGVCYIVLFLFATKIDIGVLIILLAFMCLGAWYLLGIGVANLASLCSMTFGIFSSYYSYIGYSQDTQYYYYAVFLIVLGSILDYMDGWLARKYDKNRDENYKKIGILIDDIADGVTFGYATSTLVFFNILSNTSLKTSLIVSFIYIVCVVYRLYHFTKTKDSVPNGLFEGLPSPAAGLAVAVGSLICKEPNILISLTLFISIMMICFPIKWIHFKMVIKEKQILRVAVLSLVLLIVGTVIKNVYFFSLFFALNIVYVCSPFINFIKKKWKNTG
jgi:phosphatidylserine synthase